MKEAIKNILVSGANGQVGSELRAISEEYPEFNIVFAGRDHLDLSSEKSIANALSKGFDYFINAGAYTAVDKAETDVKAAKAVNTIALKHIAKHAPKKTKIIHISTDYVYHTDPDRLLLETDKPQPQGVYAKTKLEGENALLSIRPDAIVIRTSWVYSSFGNNFVKTMLRLGKDRDALTIVFDQLGAPTYARDLAMAILDMLVDIDLPNLQGIPKRGLFNYSNLGLTNWADFAREIFDKAGIDCKVSETTTAAYNAPAPRPLWSMMSKQKIQETFYLEIPQWQKSLASCLELLL